MFLRAKVGIEWRSHNRKGGAGGILKRYAADNEWVMSGERRERLFPLACAGMKMLTPGTPEKTHPQPLPVREGRNCLDGVMREKRILERIQPKGGGLGARPGAFWL